MKNKGFTLIELLVVVAIIGILAAVVLVAVGNARTKAKDTAVIASLSSFRTQAELDFGNNYEQLCNAEVDTPIYNLITYIELQGGGLTECAATANEYVLTVVLPSGDTKSWTASLVGKTAYAADDAGYCINAYGASTKVSLREFTNLKDEISDGAPMYSLPRTRKGYVFTPFCTAEEASVALGVSIGSGGGGEWSWKCVEKRLFCLDPDGRVVDERICADNIGDPPRC